MRIKELLIDFYQELKDDNNQIYDINGIRSKISSKAEKLLNIIDKKDQQCMCIDKRIFSFLNFINGYDTPRYEDNMYLFNNVDLEREYNILGDIDLLEGINLEIQRLMFGNIGVRATSSHQVMWMNAGISLTL